MTDLLKSVTTPLGNITKSLQDWLNKAVAESSVSDYVPVAIGGMIGILMFIHFLSYALMQTVTIQNKWPGLSMALWELQGWLATVVLGGDWGIIYTIAFVMGAAQGASGSSASDDVMTMTYFGGFIGFVFILNKICEGILQTPSPYVAGLATAGLITPDLSATGIASGNSLPTSSGYNYLAGPSTAQKFALLSPYRGKAMYIIVDWIRNMTELIYSRAYPASFYGYGLGKLISYAT